MNNSLAQMRKWIEDTRAHFEMAVECAALEITEIAKDVSKAIGSEVSVDEARNFIIREFAERLRK